MPPLLTVGVALLLLSGSVLGLRECVDQAGPSCVSLSEAQCGHAHPRLSPTARLCLKSCGLCVEGPPPVCAQGYFDPGLDTCVPCSTRCHGADNCRRQLTCPQGCPPGRHGYRCQRRCPPGCPARCDRWSGLCTEGCRHGRHGDWCHKRCPPSCHSSWCSQATGRCRARRGQPAAIHRRDVSCPFTCRNRACDRVTGVCTEGCRDGRRGEKCTERCPFRCRSPRRCEQTSGRCLDGCSRSYLWGKDCSLLCPTGCSNYKCNQTTGACLEGCNNGHNNAFCTQECAPGRWGESCDKPCPAGCVKAACLQLSGRCQEGCQDGHWGPSCNMTCPSGCRACDQDSGHCQECGTGRWGERCQHACPPDCRDGSCLQDTGHCQACPEGRCGSLCNDSCSPSTGQNTQCPQHCKRGQCHPSTLLCTQGCERGYWSGDCSRNCSEGCARQRCSETDGVCTEGCKARQHGERCKHKCSTNCKDGKCHDTDTGVQCAFGCEEGYSGVYCQKVQGENNHYRVNTTTCMPCPQNCAGGRCDEENGLCTYGCETGKYGSHCQHNCTANCRHRDCQLKGQLPVCSQGCRDGFKGDYCQEKCPDPCRTCDVRRCVSCREGLWGDNCTLSCTNCVWGTCSKDSGLCVDGCVHGFHGDRCDRKCSSGCQASPAGGVLCNRTDGVCLHGCLPGWRGDNCSDPDAATGSGDPGCDRDLSEGRCKGGGVALEGGVAMGVGVATGVGGTVLLAALGWTLLRWRRRRRPGQDVTSAGGAAMPLEAPLRQEAPLPVSPGEGHYQSLEPATRDVSPPNPYAGLEETQPVPGASSSSQEGVYEIV